MKTPAAVETQYRTAYLPAYCGGGDGVMVDEDGAAWLGQVRDRGYKGPFVDLNYDQWCEPVAAPTGWEAYIVCELGRAQQAA